MKIFTYPYNEKRKSYVSKLTKKKKKIKLKRNKVTCIQVLDSYYGLFNTIDSQCVDRGKSGASYFS